MSHTHSVCVECGCKGVSRCGYVAEREREREREREERGGERERESCVCVGVGRLLPKLRLSTALFVLTIRTPLGAT